MNRVCHVRAISIIFRVLLEIRANRQLFYVANEHVFHCWLVKGEGDLREFARRDVPFSVIRHICTTIISFSGTLP